MRWHDSQGGDGMNLRDEIARELCRIRGYNPDTLEPGSPPWSEVEIIDGYIKGEQAFFLWRTYVPAANRILALPVEGWIIRDEQSMMPIRTATLQEVIKGRGRRVRAEC